MASLEVDFLSINIPLEESICCETLYKNQELSPNINKNQYDKILRVAL